MTYCIKCGKDVMLAKDLSGNIQELHFPPDPNFQEEFIVRICYGPFTETPPPPITEQDWEYIFANEPSEDEMELINQEADLLLQTLIGD